MPLKLIPPRKGKSPNWSIRGAYLKVHVDRSCGTDRKAVARQILRDLEARIERGEYPEKPAVAPGPVFIATAVAYMKAGGERGTLGRLIEHFGETPLAAIDQQAVDAAALALYPQAMPATRNRKVYTPVSAVLRHAGVELRLRRPKGAKGRVRTDYLSPADAAAVIAAADSFDAEFGLLLRLLLYTGLRISEALRLRWEDTEIEACFARVRLSKNGRPRGLKLRPELRAALLAHRGDKTFGKIFRFAGGGGLKDKMVRARLLASGVTPLKRRHGETAPARRAPPHRLHWVTFHVFRHTFATWFRRYGGGDLQGLVGTDNWHSLRSVARYAHVVPRDEWDRVDRLPGVDDAAGGGGENVESRRDTA